MGTSSGLRVPVRELFLPIALITTMTITLIWRLAPSTTITWLTSSLFVVSGISTISALAIGRFPYRRVVVLVAFVAWCSVAMALAWPFDLGSGDASAGLALALLVMLELLAGSVGLFA